MGIAKWYAGDLRGSYFSCYTSYLMSFGRLIEPEIYIIVYGFEGIFENLFTKTVEFSLLKRIQ